MNSNLLAYTTGSDLVRLSCSNMADYTSKNWFSCQVGERNIFQVNRAFAESRLLIVGPDD